MSNCTDCDGKEVCGHEVPDEPPMSQREDQWWDFANAVAKHLREYTVPQYGDVGDDEITFDVIVTDPDSVISGNLIAALYLNGIPTGDTIALTVGSNLAKVFSPIFSNKLYEVKVLTDYDLLNGDGGETAYELGAVQETTLSKATPNANSQSVGSNTERLQKLLERANIAEKEASDLVHRVEDDTKGILELGDDIANRRERIQADRERVVANQRRTADLLIKLK